MSEPVFESESDPKTRFSGAVPDRSFLLDPRSIVVDVRNVLGSAICKATVDRIVPRVKKAIDDALAEEFGGREKSGERKAEERSEKAGDGKVGEVFSLWRIDVLDEECVGAKRCKHSYAWSKSSDGARRLFQHYYKNCRIDKIEEVFSGYPGHFLTQLDSDGTLRSLNVFILPPLE